MKHNKISLLIILFLLTGCPKNNSKPIYTNMKTVWRVGLTKCEIEKDPAESLISAALIKFGVNFGLSLINNAISNAAEDKEETVNIYNSDYLVQNDVIAMKAYPRSCLIIGSGMTKSIQQYKSKLSSSQIIDLVKNVGKADETIKKLMSNDLSQLGITSEINFLMRIQFTHSSDGIAIKPQIKYLYYPAGIVKRKNNHSLVVSIDGKLPNEIKSSSLSVALKIPSIKISENIYTSTSLIDVENIGGWMIPPKEWKKDVSAHTYSGLINLNAKIVATSEGSKFWKRVSKAISDKQLSSLGDAITKRLTTDAGEIAEQEEASKQATIQAYFDALAAYQGKNALLINSCTAGNNDVSEADRIAVYYAAFSAYNKADLAKQKVKTKYPDEKIPDIGEKPKNCVMVKLSPE